MKSPKFKASIIVISSLIFFFSCTVEQNVRLEVDGSGSAEVEIVLHDIFAAFITDLTGASWDSEGAEQPIFDLGKLEYAFGLREQISLQSADIPEPNRLVMELSFNDIEKVLRAEEPNAPELFSYATKDGLHILTFKVSRKTIVDALALSPFGASGLEVYLLPPEDKLMSEEEYIDYLMYSFEPYAPEATIERVLREAVIVLEIGVDGRIVSQEGGERRGNRVRYTMPLIRLFTQVRPETYEIRYR
jgi:hypothetical protein